MNDQDFRDHVVGSLARMEAKLEDIPNLKKDVDDLGKDVKSLELSRARDRGIAAGISVAASVTATIFKSWMFGR